MEKSLSKFIIIFLFFFVIITLPGIVSAQQNAVISVESLQADEREVVEVEIWIENAEGMEGGEMVLTFSPEVVKPIGIKSGSLITGMLLMDNLNYGENSIKFIWAGVTPVELGEGMISKVKFEVLGQGHSPLKVEDLILVGIDAAEPISGEISVGDALSEEEVTGKNESSKEEDTPQDANEGESSKSTSREEDTSISDKRDSDETVGVNDEKENGVESTIEDSTDLDNEDAAAQEKGGGLSPLYIILLLFVIAVASGGFIYNRNKR